MPSGVCGAASRSGPAPCARSSSLVAGPIETSRGPASDPPAATKKRTDERGGEEQVVGGARRFAGGIVEGLGHGLVQRHDVDLRAALAQRVREHVAPLGRTCHQRAGDRDVHQRLHEPLGHRPLGHDVGLDPAGSQGPCGAGSDRRDRAAGEGARVAHAVEQQVRAVWRRDAHEVVAVELRERLGQRLHANRRRLDDGGAECPQPRGECARLRPGAGDGDGAAVQRPGLQPRELLPQRGDVADQRDRRRADALGLGSIGRPRPASSARCAARGASRARPPRQARSPGGRARSAARRCAAGCARPCRRRASRGSRRGRPSRSRSLCSRARSRRPRRRRPRDA